jgi:lycopene beta-cyclase
MTYLGFHLVFIVPPLVLLLVLAVPRAMRAYGRRAAWTLPVMALIALAWTTPWDNFLVYRGVWWYGTERVLATIGYVPVEEYLFFILQPLLTGAWTYLLLTRGSGAPYAVRERAVPPDGLLPDSPRALGVGVYALLTAGGVLALTFTQGLYLGLILAWAAPVLLAQWWFMAGTAARIPRVFALAIAVPTLYLWIADRVAIGLGIWTIAPEYIVGIHLFGLPLEEAVFFLVTNVLVVQGVLLFLQPAMQRRVEVVRPRLATAA